MIGAYYFSLSLLHLLIRNVDLYFLFRLFFVFWCDSNLAEIHSSYGMLLGFFNNRFLIIFLYVYYTWCNMNRASKTIICNNHSIAACCKHNIRVNRSIFEVFSFMFLQIFCCPLPFTENFLKLRNDQNIRFTIEWISVCREFYRSKYLLFSCFYMHFLFISDSFFPANIITERRIFDELSSVP